MHVSPLIGRSHPVARSLVKVVERSIPPPRNVQSTLAIGTSDELGTRREREDDVGLAGFGGRSGVVKGGGQRSWNGRPRAPAGAADGSGWLRGATALEVLDTA